MQDYKGEWKIFAHPVFIEYFQPRDLVAYLEMPARVLNIEKWVYDMHHKIFELYPPAQPREDSKE